MSIRDCFNAAMQYAPADRLPVVSFESYYESATLERWYAEGLPRGVSPETHLGMDSMSWVPFSLSPIPPFEERVLSENDQEYVAIDWMGTTVRRLKEAPHMYYGHIDHPVKNRQDWLAYRERFSPDSRRTPDDLDKAAAQFNASTLPVGVCFFPFFFRLGFYSMGMERFLTAFYDSPGLIHEMFSYWSELTLRGLRPLMGRIRIDVATFAEDLAYKGGPHISPKTYREFWLPYQDPIIRELQRGGVPIISLWTSGNIEALLPLLLEHGFNCTWPTERGAGMDPLRLRRRFGRDLRMGGGIPKEALIAGPAAIDAAIEELLPLMREGGFIPAVDDVVPPEVTFESFRYYVAALRRA